MSKFIAYALGSLLAAGISFSQIAAAAATAASAPVAAAPAATDCAAKAVSKAGKPLAGAAKAALMKKCEADPKVGK